MKYKLWVTSALFVACLFIQNPCQAADKTCIPDAKENVDDILFVAFDTETTGFSANKDRIVEIGCVKFKNGEVIDTKEWLLQPGRKIPWHATNVHGISNEMVQDAPTFKEVYPEFLDYIKDSVLIAHNARFDVSFIREEALRNDLQPPCEICIDSLRLFRTWYPDAQSHTVASLAEMLNIEGDGFHRATSDSLYTIEVIKKGLDGKKSYTFGKLLKDSNGYLEFEKQ